MEPTYVDSPSETCECCNSEVCRNCGKPELEWEVAGVYNGVPYGTEVWCHNCNLHVKRIPETDNQWIEAHELMRDCNVNHHDVMANSEALVGGEK